MTLPSTIHIRTNESEYETHITIDHEDGCSLTFIFSEDDFLIKALNARDGMLYTLNPPRTKTEV